MAGPMTITSATCSNEAMDGFNCGVIVSEIACALMNYNGDVIETPNLPAIIHSDDDEVGDKIVIIKKVDDLGAITIDSTPNDLGDDNELKTLQVLTPPSSPPLAPLPPSPPPLPPNDPGLPKGCAVVPVVAENPLNTGENNAIVGSSFFFIDRVPCSWEGHGPISLEVGDGEYVDFGKVGEITLMSGTWPAVSLDGWTLNYDHAPGSSVHFYLHSPPPNAPPTPSSASPSLPPHSASPSPPPPSASPPAASPPSMSPSPQTLPPPAPPPAAPPPHPPLYPTIAPPLAPFPPTVPTYTADAATKTVTASLTVKGFSCGDKDAAQAKIAKYLSVPSATIECGDAANLRRRRRLTDDTTVTVTIPTTDANYDTVLASATTLFVSDLQTATALLGGSVYPGASVSGASSGGADKDPHLVFPHGGTADFRGRHGVFYNFFSAPGLSVNIKSEESLACRAPAHRPALL